VSTDAQKVVQEAGSDIEPATRTVAHADRGLAPNHVPAPSSPLGLASGCAPGASPGSGGQLDLTAYRSTISMLVMTMVSTGGSRHAVSVPGPSVLPGFSPE
jgi:hypothetical protein